MFLVCTGMAFAQKANDSTAQELYLKAIQNLQSGEYYTAQNQLEEALGIDSTHQDATLGLMRIYYAQKNFKSAEELGKRLVKMHPDDENNWIALADIYKSEENYDGLLSVFDRLIKFKPDSSSYYYDKALTLSLKGDSKESLALYNDLEKKFGLEDRLFLARRDLYMGMNDSKKAIAEAKAYLTFKPNESRPYLLLANTYLDIKKPKDALSILNKAESKFPNDPYVALTKADTYKSMNKSDQVSKELKKAFAMESLPVDAKIRTIYHVLQGTNKKDALSLAKELSSNLAENNPKLANTQAVYGDILYQSGEIEKAHSYFLKAVSLNKQLDFVWEQLLQVEIELGKYKDAQKHGLDAINLFPKNPGILLFTGYAYMLDKQNEEARVFLEESLNEANPENKPLIVQIYSSLGDTYHALKMHAESNVAYEEALALDSNNTYVLNNFAYYLALRKEELNKAAAMSKKSNELKPDNASFQDTYAWVLFQQENYAEALKWIDKAISITKNPTSTLMEHKGDILYKLGKKEEAIKLWEKAGEAADSKENEKLQKKIKEKVYVD